MTQALMRTPVVEVVAIFRKHALEMAFMQGRSGTGRLKSVYYYYVCRNRECGLRVAAGEIEGAVLERIRELASDRELLERLVAVPRELFAAILERITRLRLAPG